MSLKKHGGQCANKKNEKICNLNSLIQKNLSQLDAGFIEVSMAWSQEHKDKQGQKICLVSSSFANFFVCEVIHIRLNLFIKEHL